MTYDIIFYMSRKTSYCEKRIRKQLSKIDFKENRALSCSNDTTLGIYTCESLKLNNMVVLIGGLNESGNENTAVILSRVLSSTGITLNHVKKLRSKNNTGYVITYKKQVLLSLPDSPDDIEEMLSDRFLEKLAQVFV